MSIAKEMIILGANNSSLLIADNNQDMSTGNAQGFILDLENRITYTTDLITAFNNGWWRGPEPNTKIPQWFDGKPTPQPSLSKKSLRYVNNYLNGGFVVLNELLRNKAKLPKEYDRMDIALTEALTLHNAYMYPELYGAIAGLRVHDLGFFLGQSFIDNGRQSAYDDIESANKILATKDGGSCGTLIRYMSNEKQRGNMIYMGFIERENELIFPKDVTFTVTHIKLDTELDVDTVLMSANFPEFPR